MMVDLGKHWSAIGKLGWWLLVGSWVVEWLSGGMGEWGIGSNNGIVG